MAIFFLVQSLSEFIGTNDDIPRVARFLSESMYNDVPTAQRRELARLEQVDLTERYGERVSSKNALPCALFVAEEDEEIIGLKFEMHIRTSYIHIYGLILLMHTCIHT